MKQSRHEIVAWVGSNVIPHEADLRARLRRMAVPEGEIGDIVQDAYLRIAQLDSVAHIRSGRAYFFTAARTAWLQRIRRERVVRIDTLAEMESFALADDEPGPDRQISARQELARVRALIDSLPARCREIFVLRRIQGVPQREIAGRLGLSEHVVEQQATRGLKLILKALAGGEEDVVPEQPRKDENHGSRHG